VKVAFGLRAHSGWAALVALGAERGELRVVDRCRLELVEPGDAEWAKAPYHAAEGLEPDDARELVARGIASARRIAACELGAAAARARSAGHEVTVCGLLAGAGMPDWSVAEVLAVHFRMHKAEGELFRDALARAAEAQRLSLVAIPERQLAAEAERRLRTPASQIARQLAQLGKAAGRPWAKDQKDAALAAWVALRGTP
jgi:hypothetical protein